MTSLTDLIERLEKAEAGSRWLDAWVAVHIGYDGWTPQKWAAILTDPDVHAPTACPDGAPPYTTSLDVALTLVPEKYCPGVSQFCEHLDYHAWLAEQVRDEMEDRHTHMAFEGRSDASFAIALCIAALKARAL